ncbi:putative odorant receptor 85d [Pieris napi]|uniref:putative odorant receptor 85d n=1 Tax=Pieris napi TaxID=78633 RepID=UPI001FBB282B|nr:putative odorant receptor 85d [Pieris napi]
MGIPGFEDIFKQIKINFWFIGIPFEENVKLRFYIMWSWLFVMITQECLYFISKFSNENFLDLTQLTPCTCIGILSIIKIVLIAKKRLNVSKLANSLRILYEDIIRDDKKVFLVKANFVFLKYLTKYFFILNAILISVYNFASIFLILYFYLKKNKVQFFLPYAILVPFPIDTWGKWFVTYIHSIFTGFICVLYFTTVDALYFIMTTHMCSHFTILSQEIKDLKANTTHLLKDIVKKHQYILKLSQDLEEIFSGPNLFNVLIGSIEICALGFNLTMGKWTQIPGVVLFLMSVLLQILMISVYGEHLIMESTKISDAAFESEWYAMDVKSKKIIILIMLRANRPQTLTAYKFSVISYESFTKIISTSWSYFTILKSVYKSPGQVPNEK